MHRWKDAATLAFGLLASFAVPVGTAFAYDPNSWNGTYHVSCYSNVDATSSVEEVETESYLQLTFKLTAPASGDLPATELSVGQEDDVKLYLECDEAGLLNVHSGSRDAFARQLEDWCVQRASAFIDRLNEFDWFQYNYSPDDLGNACRGFADRTTDYLVEQIERQVAWLITPLDHYTVDWAEVPWWSQYTNAVHANTHVDGSTSADKRALYMYQGWSVLQEPMVPVPAPPGCLANTYGRDERVYTKLATHNEVDGQLKKGFAMSCAAGSARLQLALELHHGYGGTTEP